MSAGSRRSRQAAAGLANPLSVRSCVVARAWSDGAASHVPWQADGHARQTLTPLRSMAERIAATTLQICQKLDGGPGEIRTHDLCLRRAALDLPHECRAAVGRATL